MFRGGSRPLYELPTRPLELLASDPCDAAELGIASSSCDARALLGVDRVGDFFLESAGRARVNRLSVRQRSTARKRCASGSIWSVSGRPNLWQIQQNQQSRPLLPRSLFRIRFGQILALGLLSVVALWAIRASHWLNDQRSWPLQRKIAATNQRAVEATTLSDGDAMMNQVLAALERRPNITARVRQRVYFQGQEIAGIGNYWQRGVDRQRRTRWELQTHAGSGSASFREILVDGRYLWTDRKHETGWSVTRVDLNRVRAALLARTPSQAQNEPTDLAAAAILTRGGLSRLIAQLRRQFHFQKATSTIANSPGRMHFVGRWKSDVLQRHWPGLTEKKPATQWPTQLPHHVLLEVGQADLFPYRIEYRDAKGSAAEAVAARQPSMVLASFEFYEVRFDRVIADRRFEYSPPEQWKDVTQQVVEQFIGSDDAKPDVVQLPKRHAWRR